VLGDRLTAGQGWDGVMVMTHTKPSVVICVCTRDRPVLDECLRSVLSQDFGKMYDVHVVVIENGSEPGRRYKEVIDLFKANTFKSVIGH
jgi:glycosyltransferase involved in cell wall biosynthesis